MSTLPRPIKSSAVGNPNQINPSPTVQGHPTSVGPAMETRAAEAVKNDELHGVPPTTCVDHDLMETFAQEDAHQKWTSDVESLIDDLADIYGKDALAMDPTDLMVGIEAHANDPEVETITEDRIALLSRMSNYEVHARICSRVRKEMGLADPHPPPRSLACHPSKHTPGPWEVEGGRWRNDPFRIRTTGENASVIALIPTTNADWFIPLHEGEVVANMHLLEAAPDLYDAVIALLPLATYTPNENAHLIAQAKAALAKATGRS